jgi:hypothetical protein
MEPLRSLRDLFGDLAGDDGARPEEGADLGGLLAAEGYPDLPDGLVAEAIVSYAETAPAEVAEHLSPFVMSHSQVPLDDLPAEAIDSAQALDLLTTAPTGLVADDELVDTGDDLAEVDFGMADEPFSFDFGEGDAAPLDHAATPNDAADAADEPAEPAGPDEPAEATNGTGAIEPDNGTNGAFGDDASLLGIAGQPEQEPDDGVDDDIPDF